MKKVLFFTAMAALLASGCAKENHTTQSAPVSVGGIFADIGANAPIEAGEAFTAQVIASANADDFSTLYSSGVPPTEFDQTVNFSATGEATISPVQYYPINGGPIYIRGFAPVAPRVGSTVAYTIDGSQDIMVSNIATGNNDVTAPQTLSFGHLLTQVRFVVVAVDADAEAIWGEILGIDILDQNLAFVLELNNGTLAVAAPPVTGTITAEGSAVPLTTTPADAGYAMFYPMSVSAATPLRLNIRTTTVPEGHLQNVRIVTGGNVLARGIAYTFTLSFNRTQITVSSTVTPWSTVTWTSSMGS